MTDDLDMGAILNEFGFDDTIRMAVEAGNDLAMICHRVEMVEQAKQVLESLPHPAIDDALRRIERAKKRLQPPYPWDENRFRSIDAEIWQLRVDTLGEERASILSEEDGKRSPVELY